MKKSDLSKAAAALGRRGGKKGGLTTGATKSRGSAEHYRAMAAKSQESRRRNKLLEGAVCWVCATGPDKASVPATHAGCEHLTTLTPDSASRYGLCDACFNAGPCPECEERQ